MDEQVIAQDAADEDGAVRHQSKLCCDRIAPEFQTESSHRTSLAPVLVLTTWAYQRQASNDGVVVLSRAAVQNCESAPVATEPT